jgi:hypothetical protein
LGLKLAPAYIFCPQNTRKKNCGEITLMRIERIEEPTNWEEEKHRKGRRP